MKSVSSSPTAAGGVVPRRSLKEQAYRQIKQLIVSGQYPPGTFLSERRLSSDLGMSKTPIRTALERLDSEGFVAISPQQGVLVRELSIDEIADLFEIRVALERHVARALAGRLNDLQIDELKELLARQDTAAVAVDIPLSVELDLEFHLMLCRFLGNQEILRVIHQLRDKVLSVITRVMHRNPQRLRGNCREHTEIAQAIIQARPADATDLIQQHLEYGRDFLLLGGRARDDG